MKKRAQSLWLLPALVLFLSVGISLNAQQTTPSTPATDQTQPATPPSTSDQPAAPATSDQPTAAPTSDQNTTPQTATPETSAPQTTTPPATEPNTPAQSPTPATPETSAPPATSSSPTSAASTPTGVQSFSGTIVKSGDKYMLQDEATGQSYDVDHQDEVQKYEGKRVKVRGTMDANGKTIHLQ